MRVSDIHFKKKLFPLWEIWNWSRAEKAIIGCHQSDSKWIFRPGHQGCVRGIVKKREGRKCLRGRKAFSSWPALDWWRRGPLGICLLHQVDLQGFTFFRGWLWVYNLNKQRQTYCFVNIMDCFNVAFLLNKRITQMLISTLQALETNYFKSFDASLNKI